MVYCLRVHLVTDDQIVIDVVKAKVKSRTNAELWQGDVGWVKKTYTNGNDRLVLLGTMRFLNEADMTTALNWMKSKTSLYKSLLIGEEGMEDGSFVEAHTCDHRVGSGGCTVTFRWDKNGLN